MVLVKKNVMVCLSVSVNSDDTEGMFVSECVTVCLSVSVCLYICECVTVCEYECECVRVSLRRVGLCICV